MLLYFRISLSPSDLPVGAGGGGGVSDQVREQVLCLFLIPSECWVSQYFLSAPSPRPLTPSYNLIIRFSAI